MTDPQLGDLLRQAPDDLDPASAERILGAALSDGVRRRRGRRLAVAGAGLSAAAVAAVAVTAQAVGGGPGAATQDPAVATEPPSPSPTMVATTYPRGSATEVPGGPEIETDRAIAGDAALLDAVRSLLSEGELADLEVSRTQSRISGHIADHTRDGRRLSFSFDGAGVEVTIQRWDGYAAVGVADLEALVARDPEMVELIEEGHEPELRAATTAREACAGAYSVTPPLECTEDAAGWHRVSRPSQGAAMPDTYQELYVSLFTDDGYVVIVDSYNTPAEKGGPPVADEPVLSVAESLAMARSDRWFAPQ